MTHLLRCDQCEKTVPREDDTVFWYELQRWLPESSPAVTLCSTECLKIYVGNILIGSSRPAIWFPPAF